MPARPELSVPVRVARVPRFIRDGAPRKVRVYDNGGASFDRYTVVFSGAAAEYFYRGMSSDPFHPQGFGISGSGRNGPIDRPRSAHLGKRIRYADLPEACRRCVCQDYAEIWRLDYATLRAACP